MSSLLSTTTKGPPYSWHHSRQNSYRAFMKLFYLFIWLLWVLVLAHGISVSTMQIFCCKALALELCYLGSVVAPCGLSCSEACRILLPWPEIKHLFPAFQGRHLTTWLPGKSLLHLSNLLPIFNHSWPHNAKNRPYSHFSNSVQEIEAKRDPNVFPMYLLLLNRIWIQFTRHGHHALLSF